MDLVAFAAMFDTMTDEQIAEASGSPLEAVAAFRAGLVPGAHTETAQAGAHTTKRSRKAAPAPDTAPPETATTNAAESAPACVRVVVPLPGVRLPGAKFGPGPAYRDILTGEHAAFLWEHHRAHVEPYPPAR